MSIDKYMKLIKSDGWFLKYVPSQYQTLDIIQCALTCEKSFLNFSITQYIDPSRMTLEVMQLIVKLFPEFIIKDFHVKAKEELGTKDYNGLSRIYDTINSSNVLTVELCKSIVDEHPSFFEHIPDQFKTYEMCKEMVTVQSVPLFLGCYIGGSIKWNGKKYLQYIPLIHITPEIFALIIDQCTSKDDFICANEFCKKSQEYTHKHFYKKNIKNKIKNICKKYNIDFNDIISKIGIKIESKSKTWFNFKSINN